MSSTSHPGPVALLCSLLVCLLLGAAPVAAEEVPPLLAPLSDGKVLSLPALDPAIPSPAEYLGYRLGERFTHHWRILGYLEALAETSPRVRSWQYGESYQGRPLTLLAISSPQNLQRLEELRRRHLEIADPSRLSSKELRQRLRSAPVFVWLAYGIHGSESSSAEAAMAAAYVFAAAAEWGELLDRMVILLDPLENPDGRERYVQGFEQRQGREPDRSAAAMEHREPWPGGRFNHYLIDLNRDWAWLTQQETRQRLAELRRWEPQVLVDFHEMSSSSSYYFPPAADPVHPEVDPRVLSWFETFGLANARVFDSLGWLFYKAERYDLFYPGYGDSYPSLRGTVGMTYEMAGGGRAGLALRFEDGREITLADRVARHLATSLATARTAAQRAGDLLESFALVRRAAAAQEPRTYLWSDHQPEAAAMAELLSEHGVQVGRLGRDLNLEARPYLSGDARKNLFPAGTYAVATAQPLGALVEALLGRETGLSPTFVARQRARLERNRPSEFYDITSWALPLAYGVETWTVEDAVPSVSEEPESRGGVLGEGRVGFLLPPAGLAGYRVAAELRRRGIHHRLALVEIGVEGRLLPRGTLFVPRRNNPPELREILSELARAQGVEIYGADSSYTEDGASLGSDDLVPVQPKRIGLVTGPGTRATSAGYLWHLLDRGVRVPHTRLEVEDLKGDLADFGVLLLADGPGYGDRLGDSGKASVEAWVRAGGTLVAVGGAVDWLRDAELVSVERWQPDAESDEAGLAQREIEVPGAALSTELNGAHPLTAGLPAAPAMLFQGSTILLPDSDPGRTALRVSSERPVAAGFAWPEAEERLAGALLVGDEKLGEGRIVIFAQEPAFRLFWRSTMPLLLNAVLYAPSYPG